jgi:RND family efflux transporter MFP subunit
MPATMADDSSPDLTKLRIERSAPKGGGRTGLFVVIVILLLVAAWLAWPRIMGMSDQRPELALGRVTKIGGAASVSGTAANGYVVARRQAALSTDIQGRLVELSVEEGDRVYEGDLIARLDTRQLEASRARTNAELETARHTAELAETDYRRYLPLLDTGDVSQSLVDSARTARDEANATVVALAAAVHEIEVMLSKSSVFAPFDGVITAKNAEVGEVVSSISSGGNSRGSVATLVDFDTLEVQVELAQTSLRAARTGAPVLIYLDAYPDDAYRGQVRQIWPTADRQKATVELRAEFIERDDRILPEMGVRIVFTGETESTPAEVELRVPTRAVVDGAEPFVFVYAQGVARRRGIETRGEPEGGTVHVVTGLDVNERVVLDPPEGLRDGDEVREREP